jgi:hypothetical protein
MPIYLSKGEKLSFSADDEVFVSTIKDSVENQYLASKAIITSEILD